MSLLDWSCSASPDFSRSKFDKLIERDIIIAVGDKSLQSPTIPSTALRGSGRRSYRGKSSDCGRSWGKSSDRPHIVKSSSSHDAIILYKELLWQAEAEALVCGISLAPPHFIEVIRDGVFPDYMDPKVHVLTYEGGEKTYNANIVGANVVDDLAVSKIAAPKNILKPITVGESMIVEVGQKCLLIGAPLSQRHSLASGIISGLNRVIDVGDQPLVRGLIQIDVSTNPGNSGGPLLDYEGHMIGIHRGGSGYGIGFCIPSSVVIKTVTQLIKFNEAKCPGLNIKIYPDHISHEYDAWIGVVVLHVSPYSCAAGFSKSYSDKLIEGDTIIAVGDKSVRTKKDLFEILEVYRTKVIRDCLEVKLSIDFEDY